jgi:hypothetical protein
MNKYRKKPIEVEAFQITRATRRDNSNWPNWLHQAWQKEPTEEGSLRPITSSPHGELIIYTKEGDMFVKFNDYIIQGIQGEIYPCKPDIFEATYESLD